MTDTSTYYCFTSDLFQVEPGEDEQTNPYLYGKQLSHWLAEKLLSDGYPDAKAIPENTGWHVMCSRDPFMLWIECGNSDTTHALDNPGLIENQPIIWECFVFAEVPFWKRMFGKLGTESSQRALNEKIRSLLSAESQIQMVECP